MTFPLSANYGWDDNDPHVHFRTAKQEHLDAEQMARFWNHLCVQAIPASNTPSLTLSGDTWTLKIPCTQGDNPGSDEDDPPDTDNDIILREVDVCVDGKIKKMKVMGSEPY